MKMSGLPQHSAKLAMRLSAIDIGTNTILMLIADITGDGSLSIIADEHRIARLGKGVDARGVIQPEAFARVLETLTDLKSISDAQKSDSLVACGTSALRDAANRREFMDFIQSRLGIGIKVISGEEESKLTYIGAISSSVQQPAAPHFAVLDIGGGSTEIVTGIGSTVTSATSIDVGSVRLTERILKTSPPEAAAIENAIQIVREHLQRIPPLQGNTKLIGVAGTLTTLASIDLRLSHFDRKEIDGYNLSSAAVEAIFNELRPLNLDQLRAYPQIHPFRADILLAGIIILREVLHTTGRTEIIVSERGLRYGLLIETAAAKSRNTKP
jgi:exopolyphosphatase/guanosine-5'-triphosphate,3'-diphosphate pyrophosphatase